MPNVEKEFDNLNVVLCCDLDGTLIKTDLLLESFFKVMIKFPWKAFYSLKFLLLGQKAAFKVFLQSKVSIDPKQLPYREEVLDFLKEQRARGRKITLITGSPKKWALSVANHLELFDEVFGTEEINLVGKEKSKLLILKYGVNNFDYIGNHSNDYPVWYSCRQPLMVAPAHTLAHKLVTHFYKPILLNEKNPGLSYIRSVIMAIRPHQVFKNALLLIPSLASHRLVNHEVWIKIFLAISAFSLTAWSVYIFNDVCDIESDRQHKQKRNRPFASGALSIANGLILIPFFLILASSISYFILGTNFLLVLILYLIMTTLYSIKLKRIVLLDVIMLAILYVIRLIAGQEASGIICSNWLLAFSIFFFFSLGLLKRYIELIGTAENNQPVSNRSRDYQISDLPFVLALGISSGLVSIVILALYINTSTAQELYKAPEYLFIICGILFYWINRLWIKASRQELDHDPVAFALKDKTSLFLLFLSIILTWMSSNIIKDT